jgi:hypothetical protein
MKGLLAALILAAAVVGVSRAQIQIPTDRPLAQSVAGTSNPLMIIRDRGTDLEVLAGVRALAMQKDRSGRAKEKTLGVVGTHRLVLRNATRPFSVPDEVGVVFNHTLKLHGVTTGEITFQLKTGSTPYPASEKVTYPGLRKLTNPDVYLVVARTPVEFVSLFKEISARADVRWSEPIVTYDTLVSNEASR